MIVVLDTNDIVSAILSSKGTPAEIFRHWEAEDFEVVTSLPLLDELERALKYDRVRRYLSQPEDQIDAIVKGFRAVATLVEPSQVLDIITEDPDDNRVLECAVAGGASFIVTGDAHLLDLGEYQGIVILNPRGFLALLDSRGMV